MKNFHICYYKDQNFPLLSGWNVEAKTIEIALSLFKKEFPNYEIILSQCSNTFIENLISTGSLNCINNGIGARCT